MPLRCTHIIHISTIKSSPVSWSLTSTFTPKQTTRVILPIGLPAHPPIVSYTSLLSHFIDHWSLSSPWVHVCAGIDTREELSGVSIQIKTWNRSLTLANIPSFGKLQFFSTSTRMRNYFWLSYQTKRFKQIPKFCFRPRLSIMKISEHGSAL